MLVLLLLSLLSLHSESRPNAKGDQQRRGDEVGHCVLDGRPPIVTVTVPTVSTITQTQIYTHYVPVPTDWPGRPGWRPSGGPDEDGFDSGSEFDGDSSPSWSSGPPPWVQPWDGDDDAGPQDTSDQPSWPWFWSRPGSPQQQPGQPGESGHSEDPGQDGQVNPNAGAQPPLSPWPSKKVSSSTASSISRSTNTNTFSTSSSSSSVKPSSISYTSTSTSSTPSSSSQSPQPTPTPNDWPDHTVTAYFGTGNTNIFPAEKIPWQYLTHLCFAFATVGGAAANYSISLGSNEALLRYLSDQAKAHGVSLILSLGGYGDGGKYFSDVVQNNQTIGAFVESVRAVVTEYDLAGVDIDWEHVGDLYKAPVPRPLTDADGYLQMLKALRAALPSAQLSAAVSMNLFLKAKSPTDKQLVDVDMTPFIPLFDRIYLMAYDLWNAEEGKETAGSNAALQPDGKAPSEIVPSGQDFGAAGVKAWHDAGFPMSKLVYGVPFYGYGYDLKDGSDPETTGLYTPVEPGKSSGDSDEGPTSDSGFWKWRNLKSQKVVVQQAGGGYGAGPGWTYGFDHATQTPYVFSDDNSTDPQIISYDDPYSIGLKREYAKSQGMEGMMFWAMYGDTDDAELTRVLT